MSRDDIEAAAERLLQGVQSPQDAQLCIAHFLNYWRDGNVYPKVAEWIETAFCDVLAGHDANEALGVKKAASRPLDSDKTLAIGAFMKFQARRGLSNNYAKKLASEYFNGIGENLNERNVAKQLNKLSDDEKQALLDMSDAELEALFVGLQELKRGVEKSRT